MKQTINKEKTLLVDGPARIDLLSGRASILGAQIKTGENIVVRKGKRIPFHAVCDSEVELVLSDSALYAEINGNSIPSSWRDAVDKILSTKEPKSVLLLGGIDSGKTSFCTFLANLGLNKKYKVALIDGDLGQSDLGPPGTISLSLLEEPLIDLFKLQPQDLVFIGVTSPNNKIDAILNALRTLKEKARRNVNLLIINTDGWVDDDCAVNYKLSLIDAVAPDLVVAIQSIDELTPILCELRDVKVLTIDSPQNIKKRDRKTRKILRESAYRKYLKKAKVRSFPLSRVKIEGNLRINTQKRLRPIREEKSIVEETKSKYGDNKNFKAEFSKVTVFLNEGEEEGIFVLLEDVYGRVLGMGTICNIDHERDSIKISTPVNEIVSKIRLGQIKLDREGNEIGLILDSI